MIEREMRKTLSKLNPTGGFIFYPIETMGTVLGFADLVYAGNGNSGVIELKILKLMKGGIKVPYRPGQRVFLRKFYACNPRAFVLGYLEGVYYLLDGRSGFPNSYEDLDGMLGDCVWRGEKIDGSLVDVLIDYGE